MTFEVGADLLGFRLDFCWDLCLDVVWIVPKKFVGICVEMWFQLCWDLCCDIAEVVTGGHGVSQAPVHVQLAPASCTYGGASGLSRVCESHILGSECRVVPLTDASRTFQVASGPLKCATRTFQMCDPKLIKHMVMSVDVRDKSNPLIHKAFHPVNVWEHCSIACLSTVILPLHFELIKIL